MKNLTVMGLCLTAVLVPAGALGSPGQQGPSSSQTALPFSTPLLSPEPPKWEDMRSNSRVEAGQQFEASRVRQLVADLPQAASDEKMELALLDLLPQIYRATNADLPVVAEVIANLRRQPGAIEALAQQYRQLPPEAVERRLMVLGMLGEMKRPDAMAYLLEVVWAPLPVGESQVEKLTARDLEEMVQVKAVQGLAYLATPQADAAVRGVIEKHEALQVRVAAIDAYMWNHGDSPEAATELYRSLPADLHPFVERPRFHQGMDREDFMRRLRAWREKWASQPEPVQGGEK